MILYDLTAAQGWGTTKQHGGGKYAEIVFEVLCKANAPMIAMWDSRRWISDNAKSLCNNYDIKLVDSSDSSLDDIVKNSNIKLIYSALPSKELLLYRGCKVIATLHGLRTLELPCDKIWLRYPINLREKIKMFVRSFLPEKRVKRNSLKYYHRFFENDNVSIVTVSNHTKYAIATYFPEVDFEKIPVFYSPSTSFPIDADKTNLQDNYFLMVSAAREEKNVLRAIMAFDRLYSDGRMKDYRIKLTGVSKNIFRYKLQNPGKFEFCGYVSDEELNNLYANAFALVYPSLTEGFGYPPLEAMRYGTPVLASSFTSISEVCGDAALYFNPLSVDEIMNRMLMVTNTDIRNRLSGESKRRYDIITKKQNEDLGKLINYIVSEN